LLGLGGRTRAAASAASEVSATFPHRIPLLLEVPPLLARAWLPEVATPLVPP